MLYTVKIIFFILIFLISNVHAFEMKKINISGETDYKKSKSESLDTKIYFEYNFSLYEPDHKKWSIFISGKINPAYDHFGKEIRTDVFTVLGIDF